MAWYLTWNVIVYVYRYSRKAKNGVPNNITGIRWNIQRIMNNSNKTTAKKLRKKNTMGIFHIFAHFDSNNGRKTAILAHWWNKCFQCRCSFIMEFQVKEREREEHRLESREIGIYERFHNTIHEMVGTIIRISMEKQNIKSNGNKFNASECSLRIHCTHRSCVFCSTMHFIAITANYKPNSSNFLRFRFPLNCIHEMVI